MQMRIFSYLMIFMCLFSIYGLFVIKDMVGTMNYQFSEVSRQITLEKDMVNTLKAELAYLSSPERLRKISDHYLSLDKIKVTQMTKDPIIEDQAKLAYENKGEEVVSNSVKRDIRWRYKRVAHKYTKNASRVTEMNNKKLHW